MATFTLKTPVVLYKNAEYGERIIFKDGASNPRDLLGKNGVNFHSKFMALFYRTIRLNLTVVSKYGDNEDREFNINRNSLVKYLGEATNKNLSDEQLVRALEAALWTNSKDADQKRKQAGEHGLRHAGRHNHRILNSWHNFYDRFVGSFFSWLYQVSIGGLTRIKTRFLFAGSEATLLEAGQILAKQRFFETAEHVPAYKKYLNDKHFDTVSDKEFHDIPQMTKNDYIKKQEHDEDTHINGKYPVVSKTDTSTGTTGKPTEWVRGEKELDTVKRSLALAARFQFGHRRLNYINAFALGPWATGLTVYELMRETGSVFATGPDKQKILDKLISINRYEQHQLELAIETLNTNHGNVIDNPSKKIIQDFLTGFLKEMIKDRNAKFSRVWSSCFTQQSVATKKALNLYLKEIRAIANNLNNEKSQIIVAGYPPFLKDLTAFAKEKGYNFADFGAIAIVGGQAMSEAMRDQVIEHGFQQVFSSYGASDLDINLGVETDYEVSVRKTIEKNPNLARELYGENKGLPMVFHYDPMNYHVECDDDNNLIFTCARNDRSSPRIRYNLGDKGRIYASSDVQALLTKYGMFQQPKTNLPLMFVWGRDSMVVYNGANLDFTELERAITLDSELKNKVLKKAFYTHGDDIEVWLELNDGLALPTDGEMQAHTHAIYHNLVSLNQDFRFQVDKLDDRTPLPMVRFFRRGESPIIDAGGERKQVLVFERRVNLKEDYRLPAEDKCCGYALPKTGELMANEPVTMLKV
ncbi:MAG: hypothetical protein WC627_07505 [Legionella sp.]|jgi:phenylacetate-coenzyme A ligase PaaK-like adenylate-forming protein